MDVATIVALSVSGGILAIAAIVYAIVRRKKNHVKALGKKGEKKVQKVLNKYARFREAKVLNDVYLPLYENTTQVDHILIAPFGVMVIETKNWIGEVYGNPAEEQWLQVAGEDRNKHYNPLMQNKTHLDNIRHIFKKANIYRVNVEGAVVFAERKCDLYCPRGVPVYTLKQFKKLLKKPAYEADNKVDVEKVANAILSQQITDKKKIANHVKAIKKMHG